MCLTDAKFQIKQTFRTTIKNIRKKNHITLQNKTIREIEDFSFQIELRNSATL